MDRTHLFARREFVVSSGVVASALLLGLLGEETEAKHILNSDKAIESLQPLSSNSTEDQSPSNQSEKSGKDQWRAKVKTLLGKPVVMVDVTITRTIMLDAQAYDRFSRLLRTGAMNGEPTSNDEPSGLSELVNFYELARNLPANSRSYVVVPWTDADEGKIGLKPFAEIVKFFENTAHWRVEGSPETGFVGIFNLGAQDHRMDLSEAALPTVKANVQKTKDEAQRLFEAGQLSPTEKQTLDMACELVNHDLIACGMLYDNFKEMLRVRQENERKRIQKEKEDRTRVLIDKAEKVIGDFPKGWGGSFRNIA